MQNSRKLFNNVNKYGGKEKKLIKRKMAGKKKYGHKIRRIRLKKRGALERRALMEGGGRPPRFRTLTFSSGNPRRENFPFQDEMKCRFLAFVLPEPPLISTLSLLNNSRAQSF